MSDPHFSRPHSTGNQWRRWQMDELGRPQRERQEQERQRREAIRQQAYKRNAEYEAIREHAREEARKEGYQAGYDEGYAAGYTKGEEEGRIAAETTMQTRTQETVQPLIPLAQRFSQALERLDEDIADELVTLALSTGRQLAGDALTASHDHVLELVRELLHVEPSLSGKPRLWLHPEDLALVKEHLGDELDAAGWQLQPDDQIQRGGCRATSASGELDATWEERWQSVTRQVRRRHQTIRPTAGDDDS
ncbi:flagellar assembly protein FliH [Aidingimonas lacisalsi]|uniref:flagellar assembly protein FliH n=1 Tax=Aidingimonas lacisalsi TaxID=2604086 RepID=UPI0011D1A38A|nr:flagellar assembly protein FliH [Aidingimonas lacisalsi]